MKAIFKKELRGYFMTPIGYVFLAIFYFFSGFYFFAGVAAANTSDISIVFQSMFLIVMFLVPVLTMRMFSEEYKSKTDQLLLTSPTGLSNIVLGKYFSAMLVFFFASLITVLFAIIIAVFAPVGIADFVSNFVGLLLLGSCLISIGLFVSALTKSQVVSAFGSFGIFLALMYLDTFAQFMPTDWLQNLLSDISFMGRYRSFTSGLLNIADILFFLSITAFFLFLTVRVLVKKRWN